MTQPRIVLVAGLLVAAASLQASADVKLALAVHEAARAARKQGFKKLLVVVREDLRSARDQEIGGVLRTLERQTVEALTAEPRVTPVTSRSVRIKAHSTKARSGMTPQETASFQGDIEADAVLNLDYQKRRSAGVRMTLVDSQGVYFAETVRLSARPEPDDDLFEAALGATEAEDSDETPEESAEAEAPKESPAKQPQPASPAAASSGSSRPEYAPSAVLMRRDSGNADARSIMNRLVRSSPRTRQIMALILAALEEEQRRAREADGIAEGEGDGEGGEGEGPRDRRREDCQCRNDNEEEETDRASDIETGEGEREEGEQENERRRNCPRREGEGERDSEARDGEEREEREGDCCCCCCGNEEGEGNEEEEPADPLPFGELPPLNERVLNFATNNLGNQIGRGECWDLADQALRSAGAEPARGYTFGDRVPVEDVIPGDILQFTSVRIDEPGYWLLMGTPNHTAVVQAVGEERLFILQQNFDGKRYVTTYDFNPNSMTSGTLEAFRPRPPRN